MTQYMASGDIIRDIIGFEKFMASGEPVRDIIGLGSILSPGETIYRGKQGLESGRAAMYIQADGNLVIKVSGRPVWATKTKGATHLVMQNDGNLVLYAGGTALWRTLTMGHPGATLFLQSDGNAVLKDGAKVLWNSFARSGQKDLRHKKPNVFDAVIKIAPFISKALQFIPGVGPLASTAVDVSVKAGQVVRAAKDPKTAHKALAIASSMVEAASEGDPDAAMAVQALKAAKQGLDTGKVIPIMAAKFTIPKGANKTAVVKAAHGLLTAAKHGSKAEKTIAQSVIKQTALAAKKGDKNAKAAAKVLALVNGAVKAKGGFRVAARAAKGKSFTNAYLVDSKGNVFKGNFAAH